ncbi:MAG: hypothetical protein R3E91_02400 [Chlamydiales bacterium]
MISPRTNQELVRENIGSSSKGKSYGFAILIIVAIGGLVVAGVGVSHYCGAISTLHQVHATIMIAVGGGSSFILTMIGIVVKLRNRRHSLKAAQKLTRQEKFPEDIKFKQYGKPMSPSFSGKEGNDTGDPASKFTTQDKSGLNQQSNFREYSLPNPPIHSLKAPQKLTTQEKFPEDINSNRRPKPPEALLLGRKGNDIDNPNFKFNTQTRMILLRS